MCKLEFMHQIVASCYLYLHFHFWFLRDLKHFPSLQSMLNFEPPTWQPSGFSDSLQIYKIGRRTYKKHSHNVTIKSAMCFQRRFLKFQAIRIHYWPWWQSWMLDPNKKQKQKSVSIPSKFGSNWPSDFRKDWEM